MIQQLPRRSLWTVILAVVLTIVLLLGVPRPLLTTKLVAQGQGALQNINNATLGVGLQARLRDALFEKIFVVGLPERTDRRDGITLQAALSNLKVDFMDGVRGEHIAEKAIPVTEAGVTLDAPVLGCWRGHMNAVAEVVRQNLSSVLILEDDADWDVRIRQQLHDFALATRALIQPLAGSSHSNPSFADVTMNDPSQPEGHEMSFHNLPVTIPPTLSPYGDDWDLLWVGNCGLHFPFPQSTNIPKGRVIYEGDTTVAPQRNLWSINMPFTLKEKYAQHTRAIHHAQEGVCTVGYALSQRGARRILEEIALKPVTDAYDILMRFFCEGTHGRKKGVCIAPQPPYFHSHRRAGLPGAMSDIGDHKGAYREEAMTDMVRWSVRLNSALILDGRTDYVDQYPDE